jgi:hypothetical protein
MLISSKLPHLAQVTQEEVEKEECWALQDQSDLDDLSAQVFALTVTPIISATQINYGLPEQNSRPTFTHQPVRAILLF